MGVIRFGGISTFGSYPWVNGTMKGPLYVNSAGNLTHKLPNADWENLTTSEILNHADEADYDAALVSNPDSPLLLYPLGLRINKGEYVELDYRLPLYSEVQFLTADGPVTRTNGPVSIDIEIRTPHAYSGGVPAIGAYVFINDDENYAGIGTCEGRSYTGYPTSGWQNWADQNIQVNSDGTGTGLVSTWVPATGEVTGHWDNHGALGHIGSIHIERKEDDHILVQMSSREEMISAIEMTSAAASIYRSTIRIYCWQPNAETTPDHIILQWIGVPQKEIVVP